MNDLTRPSIGQSEPLGRMLQALRGLSDAQIDEIVAYQRRHGLQFGEAAVALNLASDDDIVCLISKQFHYPYDAKSDAVALPAELVVVKNPFSEGAELIRDLRTQLTMGPMHPAQPGRLLAVASPQTGDGKTFVAANLAAAFSQLGTRTLLVDANMRQPRIGTLFGAAQECAGLSMILSGRAVKHAFHQAKSLPNLFVLPAGTVPPNPQELLQGAAFELLLEELRLDFGYIVIDTPAAEAGADYRMVAARTNAVLAVARQDRTSYRALAQVVKTVERGPGVFAGVVMNRY
ncbi:polysaccharide biosynthesis tyrosine autokinase [Massilia sp. LXY-6]|uniref:polysaccharide biosynthesis tyrosine autokinase n=1 Tax=Massilia sp. LXY-6 TaxID=3379823 RepID=UPI003EE17210